MQWIALSSRLGQSRILSGYHLPMIMKWYSLTKIVCGYILHIINTSVFRSVFLHLLGRGLCKTEEINTCTPSEWYGYRPIFSGSHISFFFKEKRAHKPFLINCWWLLLAFKSHYELLSCDKNTSLQHSLPKKDFD